MKVHLLFPDRDFAPDAPLPPNADDLTADLGLEVLWEAMARGDKFLRKVARAALLNTSTDPAVIRYRQAVLQDFIAQPALLEGLYAIPLEFLERKRQQLLWISKTRTSPTYLLSSGRQLLAASLDLLGKLRALADAYAPRVSSAGLRRFFAMLQEELSDDYLKTVKRHVEALKFPDGVPLSARLGKGNEGAGYFLCQRPQDGRPLMRRLLQREPSYSYSLPPRDNYGARAIGELRNRGLVRAANAVAQAAFHVESFFHALRRELAFFVAAENLRQALQALGEPVSFPTPRPMEAHTFRARGLYDAGLALTMRAKVVGNEIDAASKALIIITGANRGGKTTFLRSVGIAQLMMQAGLFAPAESMEANVVPGVFTHFKREEDKAMESGKFEEELRRMSQTVDWLSPHALLLCNESFSATNEREGSEIARQVVEALLAAGVKVFFVTHFYEFARHFHAAARADTLFLRAERLPDGTRTFKIKPGAPQPSNHGKDLYRQVFGQ